MEKKQYDLCIEILRRFNKSGLLKNIILIGSWSIIFYKDYFSDSPYIDAVTIKTRDIDFLIETPSKIQEEVNIADILKDLGFVTIIRGAKGYLKLDHPDLLIEFLVPERGMGIDKPFPLPKLGVNAVTLRFLSFLADNTIKVKVEDFYPPSHPEISLRFRVLKSWECFAFHRAEDHGLARGCPPSA